MPARTEKGRPRAVAIGGDGCPVIGTITPANLVSFTRRLVATVSNWPGVLVQLGLASAGMKRGDIETRLRNGASILAPPSRPAWWPTFEMFAEDVYHLGDLADVDLGEGDAILDLGAHIGTSAVLFSRRWPAATVVCVEPNPGTFAYLQQNVARNGVRAELHNEAVGAAEGRATLFGVDDASCEASTSFKVSGTSREVPVTSFERLMRDAPGEVKVVKLDCEGAEHEVLSVSTPELWQRVQVVLLEYHRTSDPASEWPEVEARMSDLGFATQWEMRFDWYPGLGMAGFRRRSEVAG
ncbi:MAG: FkbM family methyltransferase [Acidimicrobiales bacterium]